MISSTPVFFLDREPGYLKWLVRNVQESLDVPCAIDSPDPEAIQAALKVHKGTPMINSISLERERFEKLMPVISGTDFKVVALCMSNDGIPEKSGQRMAIADKLVNALVRNGIPLDNIFVDPLVQPISTITSSGQEFLDSVEKLVNAFEGIHIMCGLSNISFCLPARSIMNQAFIIIAISRGLDGAIINPLDKRLMASIITAETLAGRDDFCMSYLKAFRSGRFNF